MTSLAELTEEIVRFRDEREWAQFHSARNLAAALSIEAAELQEAMLWKSDEEVQRQIADRVAAADLAREVADVLIYALLFCDRVGIDPARAIRTKLQENAAKYPAERAKGKATKYDRL